MIPKIYSYIRFSSTNQKKGSSLVRQTEQIEAYAKRKKMLLDDTYEFQDLGVSAYKGDNALFGKLSIFLDLCKKGKIAKGSILALEQIDRLSRQKWDDSFSKIAIPILQAGVTIYSFYDEKEYSDPKDYNSMSQLMASLHHAHQYSLRLSNRRKDTNIRRRNENRPLTSLCPLWMKMKNDKTGFELIQSKADIVKKIVKYSLQGFGDTQICQKLNEGQVPTISGFKNWQNSYISKILTHPALIGEYHPKEIVDGKSKLIKDGAMIGYYPSVITAKEWLLLQSIRKERATKQRGRTGTSVANLFTGILFDARDGMPLQRLVKAKSMSRLISSSFRNGLSHKKFILTFPYEPFENTLLYFLANEVQLNELYVDNHTDSVEDKTEILTLELADIETRISIINEEIINGVNPRYCVKLLETLGTKKTEKESEITNERNKQSWNENCATELSDLKALVSIKKHLSLSDLRTKIKSKIKRLVESIHVLFIGKKKSKFKTAIVQIFFKTGGIKILAIETKENFLLNIDSKPNNIGQIDLRLFCDEVKGKKTREIMAKKEIEFLSIQQARAKK